MAILPTRQQGLLPRMANPLTLMGLGMLSQGYSATPRGPLQGIAGGAAQGLQAAQQLAEAQRRAEMDQERLELARQQATALETYRQQSLANQELQMRDAMRRHEETMGLREGELTSQDEYRKAQIEQDRLDREARLEAARIAANKAAEWKPSDYSAMRSSFQGEVETQKGAIQGFENMESTIKNAIENPSTASTNAVIYGLAKMNDPRGIVTQGDFEAAGRSGTLPEMAQTLYNRYFNTGETLGTNQLREAYATAKALANPRLQQFDRTASGYARMTQESGADPRRVIDWMPDEGVRGRIMAPDFPEWMPPPPKTEASDELRADGRPVDPNHPANRLLQGLRP